MRILIAILFAVISGGAPPLCAQDMAGLLDAAAAASGDEYPAARDRVLALGQATVPQLEAIKGQAHIPWQRRLMAGICLERLERRRDIEAARQKNWRTDPRVASLPSWSHRSGYPLEAITHATSDLFSTNLSLFCLELVWKRTSEHPPLGQPQVWRRMIAHLGIEKRIPFVADVLADRLRNELNIDDAEINSYYVELLRMARREDFALLLDAWIISQRKALTRYAELRRNATDTVFPTPGGGLDRVLALAAPMDASLIAEKLRGLSLSEVDRTAYADYLVRSDAPPVISLLGANPVTIECGSSYADAGAMAKDDKDGDITSRIVVENSVDTPKVGTYQVIYRVTDAAGNAATATRTVKVVYKFDGFLAPIGGADATGGSFEKPVRTFKLGSTIPVKFKISCGGAAAKDGAHTLQVIKYNNETTAADPIDATPSDAAASGSQFKLAGDEWHFNLDTKATGMTTGTWQLKAALADGSTHTTWIALKEKK